MRIIRKIFGKIENCDQQHLIENALKIKMEPGYFNERVYEDSEEYDSIQKLEYLLNLQDNIVGTEFTDREIEESEFLVFIGNWQTGYPQPDGNRPLSTVYKNFCLECGVHDEQIAPFQIKQLKLGKHRMFLLNWVFDQLFMDREFYEHFFKKLGLKYKDVILYKKNKFVESIVQLDIPDAPFEWKPDHLPSSICPVCNRIKYWPVIIGYYPRPQVDNLTILASKEFFGDGGAANHNILVSNKIMKELIKEKVAKIYQFIPTK